MIGAGINTKNNQKSQEFRNLSTLLANAGPVEIRSRAAIFLYKVIVRFKVKQLSRIPGKDHS
jgi:hypothetical protein